MLNVDLNFVEVTVHEILDETNNVFEMKFNVVYFSMILHGAIVRLYTNSNWNDRNSAYVSKIHR